MMCCRAYLSSQHDSQQSSPRVRTTPSPLHQRPHRPRSRINHLQRRPARKALRIDLPPLKKCRRIMMVRPILLAHHKENRPPAHQRIGNQSLPPQCIEFTSHGLGALTRRPCPRFNLLQSPQITLTVRIPPAERLHQIRYRRPHCRKLRDVRPLCPRAHPARNEHADNACNEKLIDPPHNSRPYSNVGITTSPRACASRSWLNIQHAAAAVF